MESIFVYCTRAWFARAVLAAEAARKLWRAPTPRVILKEAHDRTEDAHAHKEQAHVVPLEPGIAETHGAMHASAMENVRDEELPRIDARVPAGGGE